MINEHMAQTLLEKFYAGTTTLAEERSLQEFLTSPCCPPAMEADREVVMAMSLPAEATVPEGLSGRITTGIAARRHRHYGIFRHITFTVSGISTMAAALIVCFFISHRPASTVYADTCQSPDEAAIAARDILMFVSKNMNQGLEADDDLGEPCP